MTNMIKNPNAKVILVGDGSVGSSFAFAMTLKGLGRELGIIDVNTKKAQGDAMDLTAALTYNAEKTDDIDAAKEKIYTDVRDKAYRIIDAKGATYYGVATVLAKICRIIIEDSHSIITVGAYLEGEYGCDDIYMGTPVVLSRNGIQKIIEVPLNEKEQEQMQISYEALKEVQEQGMERLGL